VTHSVSNSRTTSDTLRPCSAALTIAADHGASSMRMLRSAVPRAMSGLDGDGRGGVAELAEEVWVSAIEPNAEARIEEIRARHISWAAAAETEGKPWLIEIYDPALAEDEAYLRMGTDAAGMVDPRPMQG
jgi:hypothetical protein